MTDRAPRTLDRLIPWYFALGMAVVVAANTALIFYATQSWSGLSASHPYERGLAYNRALDEAARQDALGWSLVGVLEPDAGGTRLVVRATDRAAKPLNGLSIVASVERPLGSEVLLQSSLLPSNDGVYAALLPALASGQWQLRLSATRGAEARNVAQRLIVR